MGHGIQQLTALERHCRWALVFGLLGVLGLQAAPAQERIALTEITPAVVVFSTRKGNVVASVGSDGALLVGTPSASSTPEINRALNSRTSSPVRYVVIGASDPSDSEADAGWARLGAFVAMQENALRRIGGDRMGASQPLPPRLVKLGVDRPRIAFSDVLAFDLNGEAIHIVRQAPGYSDADTTTHFHVANLVYLGETFPGDGYPMIDAMQKGTLAGLVTTLEGWTDNKFRVVPARGEVTSGDSVKAYREMILTVRARIERMVKDGRSEAQVVAQKPSKDFDARWGHGRVPPAVFASEIYRELTGGRKSSSRSPDPSM